MLALGVRKPMQAPRDMAVEPPAAWHALRESARYIAHRPRVAALVTVKSGVGFGNGVLALFSVLAIEVFAVGSIGTGLLFAARGAGALIGPFLLRRLIGEGRWLLAGLSVSMIAYGLSYLGVSVAPWFPLVLLLVVVAHIAGGGNWAMSNFALQAEVPDELRGRVFAFDQMIVMLAVSVSLLAVGALEGHVATRVLVFACGAVTLVYGIGWRLVTAKIRGGALGPAALGRSPVPAPAIGVED
jgi:MFS family permease